MFLLRSSEIVSFIVLYVTQYWCFCSVCIWYTNFCQNICIFVREGALIKSHMKLLYLSYDNFLISKNKRYGETCGTSHVVR